MLELCLFDTFFLSGEEDGGEEVFTIKKRKRSSKDQKQESSSSDEEEDDDDIDSNDKELRDALLKALGEAGLADDGNDSGPDLDDDQMLKLDDTLAQAFRERRKTKNNQMDVIQIKLRALDLIQELFTTTYRLDLIAVSQRALIEKRVLSWD